MLEGFKKSIVLCLCWLHRREANNVIPGSCSHKSAFFFVFYEILTTSTIDSFQCVPLLHISSIQFMRAEAFLYFAFSKWQTRMRAGRTAAAGPAEDLLRCWGAGGHLLTFITHDRLKPSFISSQRWKVSQHVPMILLPSVPLWRNASVTLTPLVPP